MPRSKRYWLVKTEPDVYGIDDLKRDGETCWDGVRNYQARNFMRDDMKTGDEVLIYHSSTEPMGVVGLAKISRDAYPDHTALDPKDKHHDPKASAENPIWMMVDIQFVAKFPRAVTLAQLKTNSALDGMLVIRRGQRLSVQPVEKKHFDVVKKLGMGKA